MQHLNLLIANKIANTSTAVYNWIDNMPASEEERKWLKKTFDGLYQLEQSFVLDTSTNDDKETQEVMEKAHTASNAWVAKILAIHDREEPEEGEEVVVITEEFNTPTAVEKAIEKEVPDLKSRLQEFIGAHSSKVISKTTLQQFGYKGPYPSAINTISIEGDYKLKREKRTSSLSFILSKH